MSSPNHEVSVRVTVRDTSSKHDTGWNDEYSLVDRPDYPTTIFRSFEKPNTGPNTTMFRNENVPIAQVPGRVADVFDEYIDGDALGLPTTGDPGQILNREDATITISADGETYQFDVFDREYVRVRIGGDRDTISNVPSSIQDEAEEYIPSSAEYLR